VIAYEEPTLRASYGAQYERYCQQVLRWIPRLSGVHTSRPESHRWRSRATVKSESRRYRRRWGTKTWTCSLAQVQVCRKFWPKASSQPRS